MIKRCAVGVLCLWLTGLVHGQGYLTGVNGAGSTNRFAKIRIRGSAVVSSVFTNIGGVPWWDLTIDDDGGSGTGTFTNLFVGAGSTGLVQAVAGTVSNWVLCADGQWRAQEAGSGGGGGTTNTWLVNSVILTNDHFEAASTDTNRLTVSMDTNGGRTRLRFDLGIQALTNGDVRLGNLAWSNSTDFATATHGHTLAGDVTGAIGNNTVGKLQGQTVSASAPSESEVLQFESGQWKPKPASGLASSLNLTNAEFSWQWAGAWVFGAGTNGVTVIGQGEHLQMAGYAHLDLRFIVPVGFPKTNQVALSFWVPNTSQGTQTVALAACINQAYPGNFTASTNVSFAGSGVATNRVVVGPFEFYGLTNATAGDVIWFRLSGTGTNWPEGLRIW